MGQTEMLKLLESNPDKWFDPREACKFNEGNDGNSLIALNKLHKEGWAYRRNKPKNNSKRYVFKYRDLYKVYDKKNKTRN